MGTLNSRVMKWRARHYQWVWSRRMGLQGHLTTICVYGRSEKCRKRKRSQKNLHSPNIFYWANQVEDKSKSRAWRKRLWERIRRWDYKCLVMLVGNKETLRKKAKGQGSEEGVTDGWWSTDRCGSHTRGVGLVAGGRWLGLEVEVSVQGYL